MCEKLNKTGTKRTAGFRFSAIDACAIMICTLGTYALFPKIGADAFLFVVVLGHFFLFCNVFRVRRSYELIWALFFLVNFIYWRFSGPIDWIPILICQTPVTLMAIIAEIRSPQYHGVFSQGEYQA